MRVWFIQRAAPAPSSREHGTSDSLEGYSPRDWEIESPAPWHNSSSNANETRLAISLCQIRGKFLRITGSGLYCLAIGASFYDEAAAIARYHSPSTVCLCVVRRKRKLKNLYVFLIFSAPNSGFPTCGVCRVWWEFSPYLALAPTVLRWLENEFV